MMNFPFTPTTELLHSWGGKIKIVHAIKHQECKPKEGRSMDSWWFDCDIQWDDTDKVSRGPVEPFKLAAQDDGADVEIRALTEAMSNYLVANGDWRDTKPEGWYAHRTTKPPVVA